jgi:hypothetical protein
MARRHKKSLKHQITITQRILHYTVRIPYACAVFINLMVTILFDRE